MSKLTTPYVDKMDRACPHGYHPTPQFKRQGYLSLNGEWDFCLNESEECSEYSEKILVPFCPESPLSGIERAVLPCHFMHYRKVFTIPEGFGERTVLHFGAVDQTSQVYLNGRLLGRNEGGYLPFSFDISEKLVEGENELVLVARDGLDHKYPYGKQKYKRGGMWYTPVSGIWQSVWLEATPMVYVEDIKITPYEKGVKIAVTGGDVHKRITLKESGEVFEFDGGFANIEPKEVKLWTPETPYLYEFTLECGDDVIESYFAIRWVDVREVGGVNRICLNGKPYLFNGMLDQGYYPDGIFMPATEEGYIDDIKLTKALGFNMLRKHIKIEPMIFYYLCDKMGVAVFQDMVNNGTYHFIRDTALPTVSTVYLQSLNDKRFSRDTEVREIFENTMYGTLDHLYNVPSVVYYTIFNEGWGQFCADDMYDKMKSFDSTRIIDSTSGWFRRRKSDVDSRHIYFRALKPKKLDGRPLVISEFGGYAHGVEGHTFSDDVYGYRVIKTQKEYEDAVCKLYETEVKDLVESGASAFVYTQVSDVEDEINGFVTYDRQVVKVDAERLKKINTELKNISEL
ncbi:MAG: glycoside hydrolase family 2 [Clostridia bacterium]|nr:glycoside hydrolase family 2 [Clostridia bacterium]